VRVFPVCHYESSIQPMCPWKVSRPFCAIRELYSCPKCHSIGVLFRFHGLIALSGGPELTKCRCCPFNHWHVGHLSGHLSIGLTSPSLSVSHHPRARCCHGHRVLRLPRHLFALPRAPLPRHRPRAGDGDGTGGGRDGAVVRRPCLEAAARPAKCSTRRWPPSRPLPR